jgi:hypothetical protein
MSFYSETSYGPSRKSTQEVPVGYVSCTRDKVVPCLSYSRGPTIVESAKRISDLNDRGSATIIADGTYF